MTQQRSMSFNVEGMAPAAGFRGTIELSKSNGRLVILDSSDWRQIWTIDTSDRWLLVS